MGGKHSEGERNGTETREEPGRKRSDVGREEGRNVSEGNRISKLRMIRDGRLGVVAQSREDGKTAGARDFPASADC